MTAEACPNCQAAQAGMWHSFTAGCRGCCARGAARSPHFFRVRQAGRLDRQYQALLDQFGLTHAEVKAAHAADAASKAAA